MWSTPTQFWCAMHTTSWCDCNFGLLCTHHISYWVEQFLHIYNSTSLLLKTYLAIAKCILLLLAYKYSHIPVTLTSAASVISEFNKIQLYLKRKMFHGDKVSRIACTFVFRRKSFAVLHLHCLKFSNIRPFSGVKVSRLPPNARKTRNFSTTEHFAFKVKAISVK